MKKGSLFTALFLLAACLPMSFLMFHADPGAAGTVISETHYTSDTIWNATGSPYFIEGQVFVEQGYNLTIEPGVEVRFTGYYSLTINGRLTAVGEPENRIVITSNSSILQGWKTVFVNSTGGAEIMYCNISYASAGITANHTSDIDIRYSELYANYNGIELISSKNCSIQYNNVTNNDNIGIFLSESDENTLFGNNISANGWHGVHLYASARNTVMSNTINSNQRGLFFAGQSGAKTEGNDIRYNGISENNENGILMQIFSEGNIIANNNISHTSGEGVYLSNCINNRLYHNTLSGNLNQAVDETNSNAWDDGYPNGGNYWTDYTGIDTKRGANQDVPGADGLGDTVYSIDSDSRDRYPLMNKSRDLAPFMIAMLSPLNNSVIRVGTIIDLDILLKNPAFVNYSLDGGAINTTIPSPFDIDTSGWGDGPYNMTVYVVDQSGYVNSSYFLFTMDSFGPEILLVSPLNNSIFAAGMTIDLDIQEPHINLSVYRINYGSFENLLYPYDLNTSLWPDGEYSIDIYANDVAGNTNTSQFTFTLDSNPPSIVLAGPDNISYIRPGVIINFSIGDDHLASANYSLNGVSGQEFDVPFKIDTSSLIDGSYTLNVNAADDLGQSSSKAYIISVDSVKPQITLISPVNNSIIKAGAFLNFSVFDASPVNFFYLKGTESEVFLQSPYSLNTSFWEDGTYRITINVTDYAGNTNIIWYNFTVDAQEPLISGTEPENNTIIHPSHGIQIMVKESNLVSARFSLNRGFWQDLPPTMAINTSEWKDGRYEMEVYLEDVVGNNLSYSFIVNIDGTPPKITETTPKDKEFGVDTATSIKIRFSEPMVGTSVNNGILVSPTFNFTYSWNTENTTLTIKPTEDLADDTRYTIVIKAQAMDRAGNPMNRDFRLTFDTGEAMTWTMWILLVAACILLAAIIALLYRINKEKEEPLEEGGEVEDEFDVKEKQDVDDLEEGDIDKDLLKPIEEEGKEDAKAREKAKKSKKGGS